jgi:hypothetical protein
LSFTPPTFFSELAQDGDIGSIGVPRAATFHFVANMGGVRSLLPGVELKPRRTYVPVPPDVEAISWRINLEDGCSVNSIRPVYDSTQPRDEG